LITCLQIAIGHPTRHSTANPKKTQEKISPKRFKPGCPFCRQKSGHSGWCRWSRLPLGAHGVALQ
jgi:hypothetical protein